MQNRLTFIFFLYLCIKDGENISVRIFFDVFREVIVLSMDVSIIIVNYNSRDLLMNCINSIVSNLKGINYEIVVVDNNSTDNSLEMCKGFNCKELIIVESKDNLGFAKANNLGVKHSSGQILHFLNPDTEIDDKLINDYNKVIEDVGNSEQKVYVNPMRNPDGTVSYGKNHIPDTMNYLTYLFLRSKTKWYYIGATVIMSRDVFYQIGGWNDQIFMYAEDADIFYRTNKFGIPIVELPTVIYHLGGGTSKNAYTNMEREVLIQKSLRIYFKSNKLGTFNYILFQTMTVLSFIKKPRRAWWQICAIAKSFE